ncbi:MAG TPA: hypothetical protein DCS43_00560 [Verrucomicrobia bacterium]|nr:hypothetical protein [Verrucomicrobiota bacterium]
MAALTSTSRGRCGGFTLIEILITVVVLSTGIVLVLQGLHGLLNTWDGAVDRLRSVMLAQEKLEDIQLTAQFGETALADGQGVFDPPFSNYRWRTEISLVKDLAGGGSEAGTLHDVLCTVWRGEGGRDTAVATRIYVAPAAAKEAP